MKGTARGRRFPFIRAAIVLFIVLVAIYVPLRLYIAYSDRGEIAEGTTVSIFVTGELQGYREPCG